VGEKAKEGDSISIPGNSRKGPVPWVYERRKGVEENTKLETKMGLKEDLLRITNHHD